MKLWGVLTTCLAAYLLLRFRLIPLADKRWKADRNPTMIGKAATVAVLKYLRDLALVGLVGSAGMFGVVGGISVWGRLQAGNAAKGLKVAETAYSFLSALNTQLSLVSFALSAAALLWLVHRGTAVRAKEWYESAMQREVERLAAEKNCGNWKELPPTLEMENIQEEYQRLQTEVTRRENSGQPITWVEGQQIEEYVQKLQEAWVALDLERRIKLNWEDLDTAQTEKGPKWLKVLLSKGAIDGLSAGNRFLARATKVALFVSLVGVGGGALAKDWEKQVVRMTELQVVAEHQQILSVTAAERREPEQPEDAQVLDEVSSAFESAFVRSLLEPGVRQGSPKLSHLIVRKAILEEFATATSTEEGQRKAFVALAEKLPPDQQQALDMAERVALERKPQGPLGQRLRVRLQKELVGTRAWAAVREGVQKRAATFQIPADLHNVGGDLLGEVVGGFLEGAPTPESQWARQVVGALKKAGKSAVGKYYDLACARFEADLARGTGLRAALSRVLAGGAAQHLVLSSEFASMRAASKMLPSPEELVKTLEAGPPRLVRVEADHPELWKVNPSSRQPRDLYKLADRAACYDDFFPRHSGATDLTERTKLLDHWATNPKLSEDIRALLRTLAAERKHGEAQMLKIAVRPEALEGFARVGGVVIGVTPTGSAKVEALDLTWRSTSKGIELSVADVKGTQRVGVFRPDLIRSALAYAADDRRLAVTMIGVESLDGRSPVSKVLLHPALVDTSIGNSLIEVDQYAFAASDNILAIKKAMIDVDMLDSGYSVAWTLRDAYVNRSIGKNDAKVLSEERYLPFLLLLSQPKGSIHSKGTPLTDRPDHYDPKLVELLMGSLADGRGSIKSSRDEKEKGAASAKAEIERRIATFRDAILKGADDEVQALVTDETSRKALLERWQTPPPKIGFRSGIREKTFTMDSSFSFARPNDRPLDLFEIKIVTAFESPRRFNSGIPIPQEVQPIETIPWVFPFKGDLDVERAVARWVQSNPERAVALEEVREFTVLQRLFRCALEGRLGGNFPLHRLVDLAKDTKIGMKRVKTPEIVKKRRVA